MSTELDKARARLAAASPYPWRGDRVDGTVKYDVLDANGGVVVHGCNGNEDPCYGIRSEEDEAFILHAASDLAAALAEVDRLTAALAEAEATIANERGEGMPPAPGWTWQTRASTDMLGNVISRYHAWLWGPDDTGFEVLREPDGRWAVALSLDHVYYFPTARAAMRAATLTETP